MGCLGIPAIVFAVFVGQELLGNPFLAIRSSVLNSKSGILDFFQTCFEFIPCHRLQALLNSTAKTCGSVWISGGRSRTLRGGNRGHPLAGFVKWAHVSSACVSPFSSPLLFFLALPLGPRFAPGSSLVSVSPSWPEAHQSPIRIKTVEAASRDAVCGPWHVRAPENRQCPTPVHSEGSQIVWLA